MDSTSVVMTMAQDEKHSKKRKVADEGEATNRSILEFFKIPEKESRKNGKDLQYFTKVQTTPVAFCESATLDGVAVNGSTEEDVTLSSGRGGQRRHKGTKRKFSKKGKLEEVIVDGSVGEMITEESEVIKDEPIGGVIMEESVDMCVERKKGEIREKNKQKSRDEGQIDGKDVDLFTGASPVIHISDTNDSLESEAKDDTRNQKQNKDGKTLHALSSRNVDQGIVNRKDKGSGNNGTDHSLEVADGSENVVEQMQKKSCVNVKKHKKKKLGSDVEEADTEGQSENKRSASTGCENTTVLKEDFVTANSSSTVKRGYAGEREEGTVDTCKCDSPPFPTLEESPVDSSGTASPRKKALKGKDMLNLLKEIQKDSLKKKKKHHHHHHHKLKHYKSGYIKLEDQQLLHSVSVDHVKQREKVQHSEKVEQWQEPQAEDEMDKSGQEEDNKLNGQSSQGSLSVHRKKHFSRKCTKRLVENRETTANQQKAEWKSKSMRDEQSGKGKVQVTGSPPSSRKTKDEKSVSSFPGRDENMADKILRKRFGSTSRAKSESEVTDKVDSCERTGRSGSRDRNAERSEGRTRRSLSKDLQHTELDNNKSDDMECDKKKKVHKKHKKTSQSRNEKEFRKKVIMDDTVGDFGVGLPSRRTSSGRKQKENKVKLAAAVTKEAVAEHTSVLKVECGIVKRSGQKKKKKVPRKSNQTVVKQAAESSVREELPALRKDSKREFQGAFESFLTERWILPAVSQEKNSKAADIIFPCRKGKTKDCERCPATCGGESGNKEDEDLTEISYLDYLNTLEVLKEVDRGLESSSSTIDATMDPHKSTSQTICLGKNKMLHVEKKILKSTFVDKPSSQVEDVELGSKPLGIARFFTKIACPLSSDKKEKEECEIVKVEVDIHPEPTPPHKVPSSTVNDRDLLVTNLYKDDTSKCVKNGQEKDVIEFLGSEVVENVKRKSVKRCLEESDDESAVSTVEASGVSDWDSTVKYTMEKEREADTRPGSSQEKLLELNLTPDRTAQAARNICSSGLTLSTASALTCSDEGGQTEMLDSNRSVQKCSSSGVEQKDKNLKKSKTGKATHEHRDLSNPLRSVEQTELSVSELASVTPVTSAGLHEVDLTEGSADSPRRSVRKKFNVAMFQMDADRKTPIKVKLKRLTSEVVRQCLTPANWITDVTRSRSQWQNHRISQLFRSYSQYIQQKSYSSSYITTCNKSCYNSSPEDESHKRKSLSWKNKTTAKQSKAHELLEKAKKKRKRMSGLNECVSSQGGAGDRRRSSRLSGRVTASMEEVSIEEVVISDEEEEEEEVQVKKRGGKSPETGTTGKTKTKGKVRGHCTPKIVKQPMKSRKKTLSKAQGSPIEGTHGTPVKKGNNTLKNKGKTPSKSSGVKLAAIFSKRKPNVDSPKKCPIDPEQQRLRTVFLHSGVPEMLRRQPAASICAGTTDYPPLPKVNHVQQRDSCAQNLDDNTSFDVWSLKHIQLQMNSWRKEFSHTAVDRFSGLIDKSHSCLDLHHIKNFRGHSSVGEFHRDLCLQEITEFYSGYSARRICKALLQQRDHSQAITTIAQESGTTDRKLAKSEVTKGKHIQGLLQPAVKFAEEDISKQNQELSEGLEKQSVCLQWTEKYLPSSVSEVVGNWNCVKKLRGWLVEWKRLLDKEALKARKLMMKTKSKEKAADLDDVSDDSDFIDSNDSEDDDDRLCNTMLVTGPHGVGKTATVYALAQELGYKVHEVNASSCRSGRRILTQLQEATQSHQVSSRNKETGENPAAVAAAAAGINPQSSFSSFFKTAGMGPPAVVRDKGKKRRRETLDGEDSDSPKKKKAKSDKKATVGLEEETAFGSLSSTTLILFEEVDVMFEDDKGFLSAVQTFMDTTKVPIILTTADPGFQAQFTGRFEQLTYKTPSMAAVASHLQVVCLIEKLRTDRQELLQLASLYKGDIRKCLLTLQFLAESGGGIQQISQQLIRCTAASESVVSKEKSLDFTTAEKTGPLCGGSELVISNHISSTEKASVHGQGSEKMNDEDSDGEDFVTVKPHLRNRRLKDDNSNSMDCFKSIVTVKKEAVSAVALISSEEEVPLVHMHFIDSILGTSGFCAESLRNLQMCQQLLMNADSKVVSGTVCLCERYQHEGCHILHNNLACLLPFDTEVVDSIPQGWPQKVERRRVQEDLYDSETSNDTTLSQNSPDNTKSEQRTREQFKDNVKERYCLRKAVRSFLDFYDTLSSMDILQSVCNIRNCNSRRGCVQPGTSDSLPVCDEAASFSDLSSTYAAEFEARAFCRLYTECRHVKDEVEKLWEDNPDFFRKCSIPILDGEKNFAVTDRQTSSSGSLANVRCSLPLCVHNNWQALCVDYMPTLRHISKLEEFRQKAKAKRRFHHYFDSIGLVFKDFTLNRLCSTIL